MTKTWARRTVQTGAIAAGLLLFAGGTASAADMTTAGNNGIANGNQVQAPIQVPINFCGNSIAVLGVAGAGCDGGAVASNTGMSTDMTSVGNQGIGNGNQVHAPIQVPINICGNAIAILGAAGAGCDGGAAADISPSGHHHHTKTESAPVEEIGALPGTDAVTQLAGQATGQLPGGDVVGGLTNQLPLDGIASTGVANNSSVPTTPADAMAMADQSGADAAQPEAMTEHGTDLMSIANNGILNGTQLNIPVQVPVDVSGNAIAIAGVSGAGSSGGSWASMNQ
ncbi:MAG TPA: chaplin [Candidatus Stackebrandtia excrementipullorum]|nr:chaplin [Candidatus Stackebrandtia excrementipullorum]